MAKILGRGAPTPDTYGILGQEYIDELTGKRYICTKSKHVTSDKAGEADHRCEWVEEGAGASGGGIVDVAELPTENIDEQSIYRVNTTVESGGAEIYLVDSGMSMELSEVFALEGATITVVTYLVEELPESLTISSEAKKHVYILESTGVAYVDNGEGATTIGTMIAGDASFDKGWSTDITSETDSGVYSVRTEKTSETFSTYHSYKSGEWFNFSNGIVDVIELPTSGVNENVIYRLLTGTVYYGKSISDGMVCKVVEELPATSIFGIVYYDNVHKTVHTYIDENSAQQLGVTAGWFLVEEILTHLGETYGGIITSLEQATDENANYLLLEYIPYYNKDGAWLKVVNVDFPQLPEPSSSNAGKMIGITSSGYEAVNAPDSFIVTYVNLSEESGILNLPEGASIGNNPAKFVFRPRYTVDNMSYSASGYLTFQEYDPTTNEYIYTGKISLMSVSSFISLIVKYDSASGGWAYTASGEGIVSSGNTYRPQFIEIYKVIVSGNYTGSGKTLTFSSNAPNYIGSPSTLGKAKEYIRTSSDGFVYEVEEDLVSGNCWSFKTRQGEIVSVYFNDNVKVTLTADYDASGDYSHIADRLKGTVSVLMLVT